MSAPRAAARLGPRMAAVLRIGTLVAVVVVTAGLGLALIGGGDAGEAGPVFEVIAGGGPDAVIMVGLLGLTLLPFGVLGVAALTFASDRERRYLLTCLATLGLLAVSLVAAAVVAGPG